MGRDVSRFSLQLIKNSSKNFIRHTKVLKRIVNFTRERRDGSHGTGTRRRIPAMAYPKAWQELPGPGRATRRRHRRASRPQSTGSSGRGSKQVGRAHRGAKLARRHPRRRLDQAVELSEIDDPDRRRDLLDRQIGLQNHPACRMLPAMPDELKR